MIAIFDAYGFDLVARSEINANPKDPANWEGGVWTLPFTAPVREIVERYVGAGGALLLSGSELGWALELLGDERQRPRATDAHLEGSEGPEPAALEEIVDVAERPVDVLEP